MDKVIMYIDMDAFFASVEQTSRPKLCGKPVAVAGRNRRTVVVASSYEAKRLGIKTGMTKGEARRILSPPLPSWRAKMKNMWIHV
jgi:DNA polymerase-4